MADAFADLWNASAPQKPATASPVARATVSTVPKYPRQDVFALLAASSPSTSTQNSRFGSRPSASPPDIPRQTETQEDAFSGLLGNSFPFSPSPSRMTIAERKQQAENSFSQGPSTLRAPIQSSSAWDGLESLESARQHSVETGNFLEDEDWAFGPLLAKSTAPTPALTRSTALLDDDIPDDILYNSPHPSSTPQQSAALFEDLVHDDILGDLGKPVNSIRSTSPPIPDPPSIRSTTPSPPRPRPASPPPHILGQLVEMGFSVQEAKMALAATDTGIDVQGALETLLANGAASGPSPEDIFLPELGDVRARRVTSRLPHEHEHQRGTPSPSNRDRDGNPSNFQEQADRILAQASGIGLSVFNKASAFLKEKKDQVQKVYVERTSTTATISNGRPRWMQGEPPGEEAGQESTSTILAGAGERHEEPKVERRTKKMSKSVPLRDETRTRSLFSDEPMMQTYVSPYRRGKPQVEKQFLSMESGPQQSTQTTSSQQRRLSPPPIPSPPRLVSASLDLVSRSCKHKKDGTDAFKLGQFAVAEGHYTSAVDALPQGHLLLIPLFTNRALTRMKVGEYKGSVDDCTAALEVVKGKFDPRRDGYGTKLVASEEQGEGVDVAEGWVKAVSRRAEALEGMEKWEEAGKDWDILAGTAWIRAQLKGEAVRGANRCRRMVNGQGKIEGETQRPKPEPPVKRSPLPLPTDGVQSQALQNLRNANKEAEAEDQQRHELKDMVDGRLLAWKAGKETNIRALLGSLDMVLWSELGVATVGMADLVSAGQVKGKYMKVIARLHPDKLNARNTTVEQRMLANGVFAALNEAWNAFKP